MLTRFVATANSRFGAFLRVSLPGSLIAIALLAAFVASCFLGAFPPLSFLAVCFVLAILLVSNEKSMYYVVTVVVTVVVVVVKKLWWWQKIFVARMKTFRLENSDKKGISRPQELLNPVDLFLQIS